MVAALLPCHPGADVDIAERVSPGIGQEAEIDVEGLAASFRMRRESIALDDD